MVGSIKPIVVYRSWLINNLFIKGTIAATIGCFILVKGDIITPRTLKHESIHINQWLELSIVGAIVISVLSFIFKFSLLYSLLSIFLFYIWYIIEYIVRWVYYGFSRYKGYRMISFEQEAYNDEHNVHTPVRDLFRFNFIKYLFKWNT